MTTPMAAKPAAKPDVTTAARPIDQLLDIMAYLRGHAADGCAWTQAQTHQSLTPYLIEESYETAEAIDLGKTDDVLRDELGDVLLQIVFHAAIASERQSFGFEDVAQAIVDKLVRRYPTILGDEPNTLKTPEEIDRRWEEIKAQERAAKGLTEESSLLDDVSHGLPALQRAQKLKARAAKDGWEWTSASLQIDKIAEEVAELRAEIEAEKINKERATAELGDLLFMLVDFARWHGIDAEDALRSTNNRFERRFRHMEKILKTDFKRLGDASPDARKAAWESAKRAERDNQK